MVGLESSSLEDAIEVPTRKSTTMAMIFLKQILSSLDVRRRNDICMAVGGVKQDEMGR